MNGNLQSSKFSGETLDLIQFAIKSDANVLITGPTGSGKSSLARMIHHSGARKSQPFITVNLASVHEGTIESELFGHERGAFTGADQRRTGRLEMAHGGTVFLDEIGELSPRLQARLLEFLQSKTITPVGSNREVKLNVRVITATHRDLEKSVLKSEFREDLFHRIRVIAVELKPLRERWEEFDELVHSCLADVCSSEKRSVLKISESFARELENYDWPGNLRELRNVLEYAVLSSEKGVITEKNLPPWFRKRRTAQMANPGLSDRVLGVAEMPMEMNFQNCMDRFEKLYIQTALQRFGGRVNRTARNIGMNKSTLIRRMRSHNLSSDRAAEVP